MTIDQGQQTSLTRQSGGDFDARRKP
jgi:hypothetical protein